MLSSFSSFEVRERRLVSHRVCHTRSGPGCKARRSLPGARDCGIFRTAMTQPADQQDTRPGDRPRSVAPEPAPRVLVVQLARLGDLLQTRRLLVSLQRDGAEVHLAVDRSLAGPAGRAFAGVVVHGLAAHGGDVGDSGVMAANLPVFGALRRLDFDRVYNLNFSGLNFALAALFDPDRVRGYRSAGGQHLRDKWPELAMRWSRFRRRAGLNLVDFWGLLAERPVPPGEVNPVARPGGGGVGVVLAGRHSKRSLPPATLATTASAVLGGTGFKGIKLLGTRAERPLARACLDALPRAAREQTENLAGETSLDDLFDVVGSLDLLLTPDTGTMHLAAHLGTPVTALFTASAWAFETGPYGLGHRVWQAGTACAPCLETAECHEGLACHEPFTGRDFLRHLSGNPEFEHPPGLLGLVSAMDPLGQTWHVVMGDDPDAAARRAFRAMVGDWLGLDMGLDAMVSAGADQEAPGGQGRAPWHEALFRDLFQERDWMLPARPDLQDPMEWM